MSNYPQPGPAPARRGWGPVVIAVVAGAGFAVLAVVGWTIFLLTRDGESASDEPQTEPSTSYPMAGKVAWANPPASSESENANRQAWSTADLVVYLERRSGLVVGLGKASGTQRWSYQVEANDDPNSADDQVCAASRTVTDGAVAISYRRASDKPLDGCTGLMMLDLATGKPRWTKQGDGPLGESVEAGAGVVVSIFQGVIAFDAATGKPRWTTDPTKFPGGCTTSTDGSGFRLVAAGARSVVARFDCAAGQEIWTLDARTGHLSARAKVAGKDLSFVGTDPVAVVVDKSTVRVLSDDGRTVARSFGITVPRMYTNLPGRVSSMWRWKSYLVTGAGATSDAVEAWDLRTGRPVWTTRVKRATTEEDSYGIRGTLPRVVGVDDKGVVCILPSIGDDTAVARLDLATGKQTDLSPVFTQKAFTALDELWWFWDGSRVIGVHDDNPTSISESKDVVFAVE